jgi:hypothetical protein
MGVDLLLGRRTVWASWLSLLLITGIFVGGFLLYLSSSVSEPENAYTLNLPLSNETTADINLNPPVGTILIQSASDQDSLIAGFVEGWPENRIQESQQSQSRKTIYTLTSNSSGPSFSFIFPGRSPRWEVGISESLPIDVLVEFGVGDATLELDELHLTSLNLEMGVGRMQMSLPDEGDYQVSIDGGVGLLLLEIPADADVKIDYDLGLTGIQVPSGFRQTGGTYFSSNYGDASTSIDIFIRLGVGNVVVREITP